jgi:hypothetical protein
LADRGWYILENMGGKPPRNGQVITERRITGFPMSGHKCTDFYGSGLKPPPGEPAGPVS